MCDNGCMYAAGTAVWRRSNWGWPAGARVQRGGGPGVSAAGIRLDIYRLGISMGNGVEPRARCQRWLSWKGQEGRGEGGARGCSANMYVRHTRVDKGSPYAESEWISQSRQPSDDGRQGAACQGLLKLHVMRLSPRVGRRSHRLAIHRELLLTYTTAAPPRCYFCV